MFEKVSANRTGTADAWEFGTRQPVTKVQEKYKK